MKKRLWNGILCSLVVATTLVGCGTTDATEKSRDN